MKCHICGCTERRACKGGCNWTQAEGEPPLCSVCWRFQAALIAYMETAHRVNNASLSRLFEGALRKMRGANAASS